MAGNTIWEFLCFNNTATHIQILFRVVGILNDTGAGELELRARRNFYVFYTTIVVSYGSLTVR